MTRIAVLIKTYGCTLNQSDSEAMAGVLLANGMKLAKKEEEADAVVLNTCTVKGATEQKTIYEIGRLLRTGKRIVVAGCLPAADLKLVRKHAPKAPIVGTRSLTHIAEAVRAAVKGKKVEFFDEDEEKLKLPRVRGSIIAKIPVAEGCVGACAFCATKIARGRLKSYPEELIVSEVEQCVKKGCKEIQLTAQDMGAYGLDRKTNLALLLGKVAEAKGEFRVRVGMMNPEHVKKILPGLLKAYRSQKIYKFAHIPVQSGNDAVLHSMRRRYSVADFRKVARAFRKAFPEVTLATDIIVGYPTETKKAFEDTLKLLKEMKFDVVNVSKFTPRPKTEAAELKQLPNQEVKRRSTETAALCRKISLEKNRKLIGRTFRVLITEEQKKGFSGRTDGYRQIALKGRQALGHFVTIRAGNALHSCIVARSS